MSDGSWEREGPCLHRLKTRPLSPPRSGDKSLLGVIAVGGAAALGALYFFLNSSF